MSDVIDRPVLEQEATAKTRLRIIDCDVHPSLHSRADLNPFLAKRWQEHHEDLRRSSAHALYRHHALSALLAADRAPRRLAADRRPARIGSRLHAQAASRSARRRVRRAAGARPLHLLAAEPRFRRRDPARHQRVAAGALDQPRAATEGLDSGRAGRHAGGDRRDRALRQGRPICADQRLAARQRAARPPSLLADLCARRGTRPAARHSRRRLWRSRADRRRLAVLLCRGAPVERAYHGGDADEPRARRRAGAFPATQDRVHRRRVRLDFIDHVADGPAFRTIPQRGAASQAPAVGICAGAFLVHDAADRRARRGEASALADRMGRRRSPAVLVGLSALGFRRSALCLQDAAERSVERTKIFNGNARALYKL